MTSSSANLSGGTVAPGAISVMRASATPSMPETWMNAALHSRSAHGPTSTVLRSSMKYPRWIGTPWASIQRS